MREDIYAAVDGSSGTSIITLTEDRQEAHQLRRRYDNQFYCSTAAGGCGSVVELNAGPVVRPYFHHKAGAPADCAARSGGGEGYVHLLAKKMIMAWLKAQGLRAHAEKYLPGGRADVHVTVEDVDATIEIQISPITLVEHRARTERYRKSVNSVTWLFTADSPRAAEQQAEVGYSLGLVVGREVITTTDRLTTHVSALSECKMTPEGIWTPHIDEALRLHELRPIPVPQPLKPKAVPKAPEREWTPRPPMPLHMRSLPPAEPPAPHDPSLHPDLRDWVASTGLAFHDLPAALHEQAEILVHFVGRLTYSWTVDRLPFGSASAEEAQQLVDWLVDRQLIALYEVNGSRRWLRAESR
jgi:hypothetical protein